MSWMPDRHRITRAAALAASIALAACESRPGASADSANPAAARPQGSGRSTYTTS